MQGREGYCAIWLRKFPVFISISSVFLIWLFNNKFRFRIIRGSFSFLIKSCLERILTNYPSAFLLNLFKLLYSRKTFYQLWFWSRNTYVSYGVWFFLHLNVPLRIPSILMIQVLLFHQVPQYINIPLMQWHSVTSFFWRGGTCEFFTMT